MRAPVADRAPPPPPPPPPHHRRLSAATTASSSESFSSADEPPSASAAKLREAQELAARLRRQVQLLEMELLLRGSESRESLTGLLSSLELRDSFRLSDCASDALFADDGGDDDSGAYDDEPEPEEEIAVLGNESFFVEKLIDPNDLTDDEEEDDEANGTDTKQPRDCCVDCEQLQRKLSVALESEEHARDAITALEARLEGQSRRASGAEDSRGGSDEDDDGDAAAALLAQKARAELALLRVESEQRIQRLEFDHAELQKREAAAQQKIDELEAELANARALSRSHQKERLEDEEELLLESGGVASDDRRHELQDGGASGVLERLLGRRPGGWGRSEAAAALLVALALLCVTLASMRY